MIRNTLAVIIGLAVGMIFNTGMVLLNTELHPMPDGVDFNDAEGMSARRSSAGCSRPPSAEAPRWWWR